MTRQYGVTMSTKPTITEDPESPVEEASQEGETLAMVKQFAAASKRFSPTRKQLGVAAIGVGSAAVVAALLYWRGNRR